MRKYLGAAAAAAAAALFMAAPAFASSDAVLSYGAANPNGTNVSTNDQISAGLLSGTKATFTSSAVTISCSASTATETVGNNPTAPGTATGQLTQQSFTNTSTTCTAGGGIRTVNSITVDHLPYNFSVCSPGSTGCASANVTLSPGSNGAIHSTVKVTTIFLQQLTCGYHVHDASGDLFGTTNNSSNSIAFSSQQFDLDPGQNSQCPGSSSFSATYGPFGDITVSSTSPPPVYTN